jgi:hypothetical protein
MHVTVDPQCAADTDCDDGNLCNGVESCSAGLCVPGTAVGSDDTNACTADSWDPIAGCSNVAISCEDNDACTTDSCDPIAGCSNVTISCEDDDACTTDSCDPIAGCSNVTISNCPCAGKGASCGSNSNCYSLNCKRRSCKGDA